MLLLALVGSAALQSPTMAGDLATANRDAVVEALARAQIAVDRIGHCTTERSAPSGLEHDYDMRLGVLREATEAAQELYPGINPVSETIPGTVGRPPPRCDHASIRGYDAEAGRATGEAERLTRADATLRAQGLWLGNLRLCGARVVAIEDGEPLYEGDSRRVTLRISAAFAPRVHALSEAFVGSRLSLVLDGTTIARLNVMEPVSEAISLNLPEGPPAEELRRAASTAC